MEDFRDIEVKAGNHSLVATVIIGLLSLLLLLLSFSFQTEKNTLQPIEIAMNFGNSDVGMGDNEPAPTENTTSELSANENTVESESTTVPQSTETKSNIESITQITKEPIPSVPKKTPKKVNKPTSNKDNKPTPKKVKNSTAKKDSKPKGDPSANAALNSILSGKGKSSSSGHGNTGIQGNVGDPKGGNGNGTGIGENWKSTIPEPQQHNCSTSGIIMVEIIVNASGNIKSLTPGVKGSTSADACLKNRAKELVSKYVRAYPGADGRKGVYKVNLR